LPFTGTDGNYIWYKKQLEDMIGYAELNEALRHFKEFGNTIVFLNLLEASMVWPCQLNLPLNSK